MEGVGSGLGPRADLTYSTAMAAIYYGLIATGYEYARWDKPPEVLAIVDAVAADIGDEALGFFARARQCTCDAYPFWPRAALLETATFYMDCTPGSAHFVDVDGYRADVMGAGNLRDDERDEALWCWLAAFPAALATVLGAPGFATVDARLREYVGLVAEAEAGTLRRVEGALRPLLAAAGSPVTDILVVLNPLKCVAAADYHRDGSRHHVMLGMLRPESIVHEVLHEVVHPYVEARAAGVAASGERPSALDPSYGLAGDEQGRLNAFEESLVRALCERVVAGAVVDVEALLDEALRL